MKKKEFKKYELTLHGSLLDNHWTTSFYLARKYFASVYFGDHNYAIVCNGITTNVNL